MIWPGVQNPHWKPSCAMKAACTGWSWSPRATPSIVRMSAPSWLTASARHELIRRPSTSTVQAPHWPRSHPFLVPVRCKALAQEVEQRDARVVEFDVPSHAVDGEADGEIHARLRSMLTSNRHRGLPAVDRRAWPNLALHRHIRRHPPFFKGRRETARIRQKPIRFRKDHAQTTDEIMIRFNLTKS